MSAQRPRRQTATPAGGNRPASGSSGRHLDRAGMLTRWPTVLALVAMWVALWGQLSIANVLGGTLVALSVLAVAREIKPRPVQNFRVVPALRYLATFCKQLVLASYQVTLAVLRPDRVRPGVLAVPLHHVSDAVATLVGNSITLTPGTLTLEVERHDETAVLYVHALDLSNPDAVRADIADLEMLAIDAFGGPEAQAARVRRPAGREAGEGAAAPDATSGDAGAPASTDPEETA